VGRDMGLEDRGPGLAWAAAEWVEAAARAAQAAGEVRERVLGPGVPEAAERV
jgi:hypothetical protein